MITVQTFFVELSVVPVSLLERSLGQVIVINELIKVIYRAIRCHIRALMITKEGINRFMVPHVHLWYSRCFGEARAASKDNGSVE